MKPFAIAALLLLASCGSAEEPDSVHFLENPPFPNGPMVLSEDMGEIREPEQLDGFSPWKELDESRVVQSLMSFVKGPCGTPIEFSLSPGPALFAVNDTDQTVVTRMVLQTTRDPMEIAKELSADLGIYGCHNKTTPEGMTEEIETKITPIIYYRGVAWRGEMTLDGTRVFSATEFLIVNNDTVAIVEMGGQEEFSDLEFLRTVTHVLGL